MTLAQPRSTGSHREKTLPLNAKSNVAGLREWRDLTSGEPIAQGDILHCHDADTGPWHQWLIIVTADCDLAHSKHGGALSAVSVLHHRLYLETFRLDRLSTPIEVKLVDRIRDLMHASINESSAGRDIRVTPRRLADWMLEKTPEGIIATLGVDGEEAQILRQHIHHFRDLKDAKREGNLDATVRAAAEAKVLLGEGRSTARARSGIARDLADSLLRLPGDAMFLNSIAPEERDGYVVYLRRLHELHESQVFTSIRRASDGYLRTGRLMPPYIYALTQRLANVFSSIGLPSHYEDQRDETTRILALLLEGDK